MRRRVWPPPETSASVVTCLPVFLEMQGSERMVSRTRQVTDWSVLAWIHSSVHSVVAQDLIP